MLIFNCVRGHLSVTYQVMQCEGVRGSVQISIMKVYDPML